MWYWILAFAAVAVSVATGTSASYAMVFALFLFSVASFRRGRAKQDLFNDIKTGAYKARRIIQMHILISMNTAAWMASGCIAALIQYSVSVMVPALYLPITFLFCALVSYLLGSCFATVSTVGIVFYMIGCAGGVPAALAAGAVISGAYVGDRASPISSALFLLANMTEVDHQKSIRLVGRSSVIPLLLTAALFFLFSLLFPLEGNLSSTAQILNETFHIRPLLILPAVLLLGLGLLRQSMSVCLVVSGTAASLLALFYQKLPLSDLLLSLLKGFRLEESHVLYAIIKGGGVLTMINTMIIVLASCALAVVLREGDLMPRAIQTFINRSTDRFSLNWRGSLLGLLVASIGCNQTMPIVTVSEFMLPQYARCQRSKEELMLDISFGGLLLAAVPPWSLGASFPMAVLHFEGYGYMPFMFFIYISFFWHFLQCARQRKKEAAAAVSAE